MNKFIMGGRVYSSMVEQVAFNYLVGSSNLPGPKNGRNLFWTSPERKGTILFLFPPYAPTITFFWATSERGDTCSCSSPERAGVSSYAQII